MFTVGVRRSILLVCLVALASCGSDTPAAPSPTPVAPFLKTVAFASSSLAISTVGQTAQLRVIGTYSDGSTKDMTSSMEFSSNRYDLATASPSGLVTAWAPGTATFTAVESIGGSLIPVATTALSVASGPPTDPTLVPMLLGPDDNASITAAPTGILTFNWASVPGATAYHVSFYHDGASFPAIDKSDIANPPWQFATGGIGSSNFSGWHWSVQAQVNGVFQAWSAFRAITFTAATSAARAGAGRVLSPSALLVPVNGRSR